MPSLTATLLCSNCTPGQGEAVAQSPSNAGCGVGPVRGPSSSGLAGETPPAPVCVMKLKSSIAAPGGIEGGIAGGGSSEGGCTRGSISVIGTAGSAAKVALLSEISRAELKRMRFILVVTG